MSKMRPDMRIISFIEDDATIKKGLIHLGLWMTLNHDPPSAENDLIALHIQPHRSFEWWEAVNHVSISRNYEICSIINDVKCRLTILRKISYSISSIRQFIRKEKLY